MLKIDIITLFPEVIMPYLNTSILKRAREAKTVDINCTNPREFTKDKHKTVDDRPYGGGAGMLMKADPLYKAIKKVKKTNSLVILTSPRGKKFSQELAKKLAKKKHLIIVCGHYEGVDARIYPEIDLEISLGDFILTGGELAALSITDAITRLQKELLKKKPLQRKKVLKIPYWKPPNILGRRFGIEGAFRRFYLAATIKK